MRMIAVERNTFETHAAASTAAAKKLGLRTTPRPTASVSIDLDNLWSYLKTANVPGWESYPGYLDLVVPRILECLKRHDIRATFFIVGRDAANPENHKALRSIADAGHEIANHSFEHEPWMPTFSDSELAADFQRSEEAILTATGQRPRGFRGPGFCTSSKIRDILLLRGYKYDASLLPTFIGPVARFYFQLVNKLPAKERGRRKLLYGGFSNATLPLHPFEIRKGLMEVPVTTMPVVRLPMHLSYLLFIAKRSSALARLYWNVGVQLCRLNRSAPSLLLHPTDFLDLNDVPELKAFPAMGIPSEQKIALVDHTLRSLRKYWAPSTIADHAYAHAPTPANVVPFPSRA